MRSPLPLSSWFNYWTLRLLLQSTRTAQAGLTAAFGLVVTTGAPDLAYFFFSSPFQEVGVFCICSTTGQSRRKRNSEEACLISPPSTIPSPTLTHSLCSISLHFAAMRSWDYVTRLRSPDASFSPGDYQTGKGKSNKTKTELEWNCKGILKETVL